MWKEEIDKKYGITSSVDPNYRFLRAERIQTLITDIESLLKEQRDEVIEKLYAISKGLLTYQMLDEPDNKRAIKEAMIALQIEALIFSLNPLPTGVK